MMHLSNGLFHRSIACFTLLIVLGSCSQTQPSVTEKSQSPAYDSALAKLLGADQYGMKKYVMAFLKAGPNRDQDSVTAANLQKAHLQNITRMAEEGKLIVAGPFLDDTDLKGIYIFNVNEVKEAVELTKTDPAIKAGRLKLELHPWYGSASLIKSYEVHKTLQKNDSTK